MEERADGRTLREQAEVEGSLLYFLSQHCPEVCQLWNAHPLFSPVEEDLKMYSDICSSPSLLLRKTHADFVLKHVDGRRDFCMSSAFYSTQPWVSYWCLNAADILGITDELYRSVPASEIAAWVMRCLTIDQAISETTTTSSSSSTPQHAERGLLMGFAGGPDGQIPFLACTYTAVCSLVILNDAQLLLALPRAAIKRWLLSLRTPEGSFRMYRGGEVDVRASYCAAIITTLLQLDEPSTFDGDEDGADVRDVPVLTPLVAHYVAGCQNDEGGFMPNHTHCEAHGSYTFLALATLIMCKQPQLCQLHSLRRWLVSCQQTFEGGFTGRINKLVDSCYSHWIGGSLKLLGVCEAYLELQQRQASGAQGTPDTTPLLAADVLALDEVQVIDVRHLQCVDHAGWDAVEKKRAAEKDAVANFLASNNSIGEEEAQHRRSQLRELRSRMLRAHPSPGMDMHPEELEAVRSFDYAEVGRGYHNQRKLQQYILWCTQRNGGGLSDKPSLRPDVLHSSASLCGLSYAQDLAVSQHAMVANNPQTYVGRAVQQGYLPGTVKSSNGSVGVGDYGVVLGERGAHTTTVRAVNALFGLCRHRVAAAFAVWGHAIAC